MTKECIILAGGFGTRLQSVVKYVPKCMAEVAGKPFLFYLLKYISKQNFDHIILSLGYKSEIIIDWLNKQNLQTKISYVEEQEPLGTGGAIKFAFNEVVSEEAVIINGDTFFNINTNQLYNFHQINNADITIALKPMINFDRYGSVQINDQNRIIRFNEKQFCEKGLINGGIYLIKKEIFDNTDLPQKFSFEKDILEGEVNKIAMYGDIQDTYFIDIGIPSDYEKADKDFAKILF